MVVTCENCATRFKFDERRIKPQGIKVHCSRCRRTFVLMPPAGAKVAAETPPPARTETRAEAPVPAKASPPDSLPALESEVYPESDLPEDDPLADVPGFDPDEQRLPARSAVSEEEKALEALTRDEELESGVSDALDRFGVSFPGGSGGDDSLDPDGGDAVESAEGFDGDGAAEGSDLDLSDPSDLGAETGIEEQPGDESRDGGDIDLPPLEGDESEVGGGAPEDFDWDRVSFSKEREALDVGAVESEGAAGDGDEESFIESTAHEGVADSDAGAGSGEATKAASPVFPEEESLELDLPGAAAQRIPVSSPPAAQATPAPASGAALDLASGPAAAPERAGAEKPAAARKAKPVAVPPLRLRTRPDRASLAVPRLPGLVLSIGLFLAAAGAGAILTLAPGGGGSQMARPAGEATGRTALVIEGARGVTIDRLQGGSLYLVTGTARWKQPPERSSFLEGVITDAAGKVLERRPARLGEITEWKTLEGVDPDLFTPVTPLPRDGKTPFSLLFAPAPTWRGEVRFEVRTGR